VTYWHKPNQAEDSGIGKIYYVNNSPSRREYGKEDACKPKRTSNTAICSNLWQFTATYGNL
jgi:hypothetical protein